MPAASFTTSTLHILRRQPTALWSASALSILSSRRFAASPPMSEERSGSRGRLPCWLSSAHGWRRRRARCLRSQRRQRPFAKRSRAGVRSHDTSMRAASRSTTPPLSGRSAPSLWAARTISSVDPTVAARAQPPSILVGPCHSWSPTTNTPHGANQTLTAKTETLKEQVRRNALHFRDCTNGHAVQTVKSTYKFCPRKHPCFPHCTVSEKLALC